MILVFPGIAKEEILEFVFQSKKRLTPRDIQLGLSQDIGKKEIKIALKELIAEEKLIYTYEFGRTFVELSTNRPVYLTERIILMPPGRSFDRETEAIKVILRSGIAFGNGQHPTTVLALQGIERLFTGNFIDFLPEDILDIGTGSGVLALAGVKFGARHALAIDLDPNAVFEARENIALNGLENNIKVLKTSVECIQGKFHLILANLRAPSLKEISHQLIDCSCQRAVLIISGFHPEESQGLIVRYKEAGWSYLDSQQKQGWEMAMLTAR